MTLSIIIPVFNVESYLENCIDSVLAQISDQCEIILVDDGSYDKCPQICDRYSEQYSNVSVIHQKNQGLSSARNTGIAKAKGDYLLFLDSDDILLPDVIRIVEETISSNPFAEAFFFAYKELIGDNLTDEVKGSAFSVLNGCYSTTSEESERFVSECLELWPAWRTIVKNSFIKASGLTFPVGLIHEDVDWTARLFLSTNIIGIFDIPIIGYRIKRVGAITEKIKYKSFDNTYNIVNSLLETMDSFKNDKIKPILCERLSQACFSMLRAWKNCSPQEAGWICTRLNECYKLLSYSKFWQHRLFYIILRLFGVKITLKLYSRIIN